MSFFDDQSFIENLHWEINWFFQFLLWSILQKEQYSSNEDLVCIIYCYELIATILNCLQLDQYVSAASSVVKQAISYIRRKSIGSEWDPGYESSTDIDNYSFKYILFVAHFSQVEY